MQPSRRETDLKYAAAVAICGIIVGLTYHMRLWDVDARGLSSAQDRLPYWDFSNLWMGGRLALEGRVDTLFDAEAYRAALRQIFPSDLPDQEWSYPPSMLLFGAPIAVLPILPAYLIWTFGTIFAIWLAIRPFKLPVSLQMAIILSPAVMMNAMFGQNGALTAALLIGGLAVAPKRPILAGILFGLLTVKPHLGVLIPVCLIASGNWRAIFSAGVTAVLLLLATGLAFGFDVWPLFLTETRPLMTAIMEAPYPQHYHANAITVFILARSAGASVGMAYATQLLIAAAVSLLIWRLWRPSTAVDHRARVVLTAASTILATPYGYTYDIVPLSLAVVWLYWSLKNPPKLFLAIVWLFPLFAHWPNYYGVGIGVLVPLALCAFMAWAIFHGSENRRLPEYGPAGSTAS